MISTPINSKDLVCHYRGNSIEALKYAFSRTARLRQMRDTHDYSEGADQVFDNPATLSVLRDGLATFLGYPNKLFRLVLGHRVSKKYIELLIHSAEAAAAARRESVEAVERRIVCRRLRERIAPAPMTKFLLLDYQDSRMEAIFGWGDQTYGAQGRIFSVIDHALVREFDAAFNNLWHAGMSEEVSLRSLLGAVDGKIG